MLVLFLVTSSCKQESKKPNRTAKIDVQGHRGARGLMPENTIPAFLKAVELGVTTLELDLAVTKDLELVVSHEPYMAASICLKKPGEPIDKSDERQYNIYQMKADELTNFDCGSKPYPRFPEQKKMSVSKPLLKDVVQSVRAYTAARNSDPLRYNIEIKSSPEGDDVYHPNPKEFSDLVYAFMESNMELKMVTVQSFDFRVLQYFNKTYPAITLAALVENNLGVAPNLKALGFDPDIYSCDYTLLDQKDILGLNEKSILVIPWTVNDPKAMTKLISWGVDGLITDYPDKAMRVITK